MMDTQQLKDRAKHILENGGLLARDTAMALIEALEAAEFSRRDAAAGEPVAWMNIREGDPTWPRVFIDKSASDADVARVELMPFVTPHPLYTAAQPAALLPEMETPSAKMTYSRGHADGWNDYRTALANRGAQPEKVVQVPRGAMINGFDMVIKSEVIARLNEAGVKWVAK